jgi:hypothetical protein
LLVTNFTPTIIGPNFKDQENLDWLDSYLQNHPTTPKYFWKSTFSHELNQDVTEPNVLQIRNNLNHRIFSKFFKGKWERLTSINQAPELRIELKYVNYQINHQLEQKVIEVSIIPLVLNHEPIHSYFSITLHPDQGICLIDDFYPEVYMYGWGSISYVILEKLDSYLRYSLPFEIKSIFVCSVPDTYLFWKKMGYLTATKNKWGSHFKNL